jgi:hypothetical protein
MAPARSPDCGFCSKFDAICGIPLAPGYLQVSRQNGWAQAGRRFSHFPPTQA